MTAYDIRPHADGNPDRVTVTKDSGTVRHIHKEDADPESVGQMNRLAAAYFGNSAQPANVFAAVIEWPDNHGRSPALILARSIGERDAQVRAAIVATADALTDPEWRDALTDHHFFPQALAAWESEVFDDMDERPTITTFDTEF